MVMSCCCYGCTEKFVKGGSITFHGFPKDEALRKLWTEKIRRKNFIPSKYSKVCSKHFEESCFDRNKLGGTWLKPDAVPTIFDFPNHLPTKQVTYYVLNRPTRSMSLEPSIAQEVEVLTSPPPSNSPIKHYRYIGDFTEEEMSSPSKARKALFIAKKQLASQQKKMMKLRANNHRFKRKIATLTALLEQLKRNADISEDISLILEAMN